MIKKTFLTACSLSCLLGFCDPAFSTDKKVHTISDILAEDKQQETAQILELQQSLSRQSSKMRDLTEQLKARDQAEQKLSSEISLLTTQLSERTESEEKLKEQMSNLQSTLQSTQQQALNLSQLQQENKDLKEADERRTAAIIQVAKQFNIDTTQGTPSKHIQQLGNRLEQDEKLLEQIGQFASQMQQPSGLTQTTSMSASHNGYQQILDPQPDHTVVQINYGTAGNRRPSQEEEGCGCILF